MVAGGGPAKIEIALEKLKMVESAVERVLGAGPDGIRMYDYERLQAALAGGGTERGAVRLAGRRPGR